MGEWGEEIRQAFIYDVLGEVYLSDDPVTVEDLEVADRFPDEIEVDAIERVCQYALSEGLLKSIEGGRYMVTELGIKKLATEYGRFRALETTLLMLKQIEPMAGDAGEPGQEGNAGSGGDGGTVAVIGDEIDFSGEASAEGGKGGDVVTKPGGVLSLFRRGIGWVRKLLSSL